jgi:hypothetical protein
MTVLSDDITISIGWAVEVSEFEYRQGGNFFPLPHVVQAGFGALPTVYRGSFPEDKEAGT